MEATTSAVELQIGAAPRSAWRCTEKYIEDAPQVISRIGVPAKNMVFYGVGFGTNSHFAKPALLGLGKGGA